MATDDVSLFTEDTRVVVAIVHHGKDWGSAEYGEAEPVYEGEQTWMLEQVLDQEYVHGHPTWITFIDSRRW